MKWIDIDEQFPETACQYLCTDGEHMQIMTYFGEYKGSPDWSSPFCETLDVTHWMELPELPNGE